MCCGGYTVKYEVCTVNALNMASLSVDDILGCGFELYAVMISFFEALLMLFYKEVGVMKGRVGSGLGM